MEMEGVGEACEERRKISAARAQGATEPRDMGSYGSCWEFGFYVVSDLVGHGRILKVIHFELN